MVDGFLVVDKPAGITSHDVVSRVRRAFGMKRVGHTGTLDPFATGVLPIALGSGTKVIPFLDESIKEYQAVMRLGAATDTLDLTGRVMFTGDWSQITAVLVEEMFSRFTGSITQVPPMFSAIKQGGVPLYRLARKGETVERQQRQVTVHSISIDRWQLPDIAFTIRCSKGTYVRSIADDIGRELGCGAHLIELRRTASGLFSLSQAIPLDALPAVAAAASGFEQGIISPAEAVRHLHSQQLTPTGCRRVRHGIAPQPGEYIPDDHLPVPGERFMLLCQERLVAMAEWISAQAGKDALSIRLIRVFDQECPLHPDR